MFHLTEAEESKVVAISNILRSSDILPRLTHEVLPESQSALRRLKMAANGIPNNVIRLDKWPWAANFFKTRALTAQAVAGDKVWVNGERVEAARCRLVSFRVFRIHGFLLKRASRVKSCFV